MWDINKSLEDVYSRKQNINLLLKADKVINPFTNFYPITWTGFLGLNELEIIQDKDGADFQFKIYPEKYLNLKQDIIEAINNCMDLNM